MKIVADRLKEIALASRIDHEIDQFGRSAFNRYYYAAYLAVREKLMEINSGWAKIPHKNLPDILTISIYKSAKNKAKKLNKNGMLNKRQEYQILTSIRACGDELSAILQSGYEARTHADYFPDEIVTRNADNNLILYKYSTHQAQSWPRRAEIRAGQLLKLWRQFG
jgi:hypothetical protein